MPKNQQYVVLDPNTGLYLTVYSPDANQWGNSSDAITFDTLAAAQSLAERIGGGTVGSTKP